MIVVDTSVLVAFLRGHDTEGARTFRTLESEGIPYAIPAICCQELLSGARDQTEWELLLAYLETQNILVPHDQWRVHTDAARIYFDCRRQGSTPSSSADCYIAACVLEADGILLHDDADFERIKAVRALKTLASGA